MRTIILVISGLVAQGAVAEDALENAFASCRKITSAGEVTCSLSQREPGLFDLILVGRSHESLGSYIVAGADIAKTVCLKNDVYYTTSVLEESGNLRSMIFKCSASDHKLTKHKGWHVNGEPTAPGSEK